VRAEDAKGERMTSAQEWIADIEADEHNGPLWRGDRAAIETAGGRVKVYAQFRQALADAGLSGREIDAIMKEAPFRKQADNPVKIHSPRAARTLAAKKDAREKRQARKAAQQPQADVPSNVPVADDERSFQELPVIQAAARPLHLITADAQTALVAANWPRRIFVRARGLVRVVQDEHGHSLAEHLDVDALRGEMARSASYIKINEKGIATYIAPPQDVVRDLLSLSEWDAGLKPLAGITEIPVLRLDGSILNREGFDSKTGLFYQPARGLVIPPIPEKPTRKDIEAAVAVILDILHDFPFVSDAAKANAIGLLLTPIMRTALGPLATAPLAMVDAPTPGTGKGLLIDIIAIVATGRTAELISPDRNDEEWRKTLFALLRDGKTFIVIDNAEKTMISSSLSQTLTAAQVYDRVLGVSEGKSVPNLATWSLTGNNVTVGGDLIRRTYRTRLDAKVARPGLRKGPDEKTEWRYPNLREHVTEHRGEILWALLTLGRAWFVAGCPRASSPVLGSFEGWSIGVGGVLAHAGIEEFLGNLEEDYDDTDAETREWEVFLRTWREVFGPDWLDMTAIMEGLAPSSALAQQSSEATGAWDAATHARVKGRSDEEVAQLQAQATSRKLQRENAVRLRNALPTALADTFEAQRGKSFRQALGMALTKVKDRRHGTEGLFVEVKPDSHTNVNRYRVRTAYNVTSASNGVAHDIGDEVARPPQSACKQGAAG
jgi:hypothetical protein